MHFHIRALESFRTRLTRPWLNLPIIWDVLGHGKEEKIVVSIVKEIIQEVSQLMYNILSQLVQKSILLTSFLTELRETETAFVKCKRGW